MQPTLPADGFSVAYKSHQNCPTLLFIHESLKLVMTEVDVNVYDANVSVNNGHTRCIQVCYVRFCNNFMKLRPIPLRDF